MPLLDVLAVNGHVVFGGTRDRRIKRVPTLAKLRARLPLIGDLLDHLEIPGERNAREPWDTIVCYTCAPAPVLIELFHVSPSGKVTGSTIL